MAGVLTMKLKDAMESQIHSKLINHSHPSIWLLVEIMCFEFGVVDFKVGQRVRPSKKKKIHVELKKKKLIKMFLSSIQRTKLVFKSNFTIVKLNLN